MHDEKEVVGEKINRRVKEEENKFHGLGERILELVM